MLVIEQTQDLMQRSCGNSGLELSVLGLGCWAFGGGEYWGGSDQKQVNAVVTQALESGINYFDTAEVYNEGRSERALGLALKPLPREAAIIGSKISPSNCYPGKITRHCEASLARLQTDYLDIYMLHWPLNSVSLRHFTDDRGVIANPPVLIEVLEEFKALKRSGKIRHLGISNFGSKRLNELVVASDVSPVVNELPYNLLSRAIEFDTIAACRRQNCGIIGYMTLMQGVLGPSATSLDDLPPQLRRTRHFDSRKNLLARHGGKGAEPILLETLNQLHKLARQAGCSLPELAIRWVVAKPEITCALVGVRSPERLIANVDAAANPLSPDLIKELDRITAFLKQALGPGIDYYESSINDRT